ncbi:hypothetical protein BZA77DRAFT_63150 [Pyronema omphalodes]|nr:hypothetical protein BZA77DRAFT_63150 [Pyronema omphalodes]
MLISPSPSLFPLSLSFLSLLPDLHLFVYFLLHILHLHLHPHLHLPWYIPLAPLGPYATQHSLIPNSPTLPLHLPMPSALRAGPGHPTKKIIHKKIVSSQEKKLKPQSQPLSLTPFTNQISK